MAPQPGNFPTDVTQYPGPYQPGGMHPSEELPLGRWHVMANGRILLLDIHGVSGSRVDASLSSGQIVNAEWDESSGKLTFTRVTSIKQDFRGYLMQFDPSDVHWRMAGVYGNVQVGEQTGWYATRPRDF